jgi:hypothetical protein
MENDYKQPSFSELNFHCPSCGVLAFQNWKSTNYYEGGYIRMDDVHVAFCQNCKEKSIWKDEKMIFPKKLTAPLSHKDMPESVKVLYEEARNISNDSPRAAAALLRVSLEKLTEALGETGGTLNTRIGNLNKKGVPQKVIQSLDVVRIFANEGGSHAGEIDLSGEDNQEIVNSLFKLVNFIIEKTISENKQIDDIYGKIPQEKKDGILNRDK